MLSLDKAFRDDRLMKALTGLSVAEFTDLQPRFTQALQEAKRACRPRKRRPGAGRTHTLLTIADKLFYILFYVKCYPTFDVAAFLYDVDRAQAHRWFKGLLPVLEATLGHEAVLPSRKAEDMAAFFARIPEMKDVFIDGVERPVQRSKEPQQQKEDYSGKKKRHTRKNLIVTDGQRRVLALSDTASGHRHDYAMFKEWEFPSSLPDEVSAWVDLGFQGIEGDFPDLSVCIPAKKPKGKELNEEQRILNFLKASIRVVVEHAIGGIKRLGAVAQTLRNRLPGLDDAFMLISCGLWNYHLKKA